MLRCKSFGTHGDMSQLRKSHNSLTAKGRSEQSVYILDVGISLIIDAASASYGYQGIVISRVNEELINLAGLTLPSDSPINLPQLVSLWEPVDTLLTAFFFYSVNTTRAVSGTTKRVQDLGKTW